MKAHVEGQFYFRNDPKKQMFLGKILELDNGFMVIDFVLAEFFDFSKDGILFGYLSDGSICTVFGNFSTRYSDVISSYHFVKKGRWGVSFYVIGEHVSEDLMVSSIGFNFDGMDSFFCPNGHLLNLEDDGKPVWSVSYASGLSVNLLKNFKKRHLGASPMNDFSGLPSGLSEIFIKEIYSDVSRENVYIKIDANLGMEIRSEVERDVVFLFNQMIHFVNLFSILMHGPVLFYDVKVVSRGREFCLYVPHQRNSFNVAFSKKKLGFYESPFMGALHEVSCAVVKWFENNNQFSLLSSMIQLEVELKDDSSVYSEIVIYSMMFEGISSERGGKKNYKYQLPIDEYALPQIKEFLQSFSKKTVGEFISDIRNEIAHISKKRKFIGKLNSSQLRLISLCMRGVVISYCLDRLGVCETVRSKYQKEHVCNPILYYEQFLLQGSKLNEDSK